MLGDLISKEVLKTFNNLLNRGKPTVRSNGVKEWTVLASIVTIDGDDVEPICLSTGVKTLPEKFRSYSKGLMVHDSHAETLSFRLLNWVLLDECEKIEDGGSSKLVEKSGELFKWKEGKKLALFVTEPPCGDASMSYITDELEDKTPWNKEELEPVLKKQKVVRGRNSIDKLGVVRTKPGRTDSLISLSKSCSDKICMKQFTGLTNSVTSRLFPSGVFLDYLVLQQTKYNQEDIARCFTGRLQSSDGLSSAVSMHPLKVLPCNEMDYPFCKDSSAVTSPLSILYIPSTKTHEVLNNGVRDGGFTKNKPPKRGRESFICNQSLFVKASTLLPSTDCRTYITFKEKQEARNHTREIAKKILGDWTPTGPDDFELPKNSSILQ